MLNRNETQLPVGDPLTLSDNYFLPLIPLIAGAALSGTVAAGAKIAVDKLAKPKIEEQLDKVAGNQPAATQPTQQTQPTQPPVSRCTEASRVPGYEYAIRKQQPDGSYACAPGWIDTGCSWQDEGRERLQCKRIKPVSRCTETSKAPGYEYMVRKQQADGSYACLDGWTDTGCGWQDKGRGHLQCKRPS